MNNIENFKYNIRVFHSEMNKTQLIQTKETLYSANPSNILLMDFLDELSHYLSQDCISVNFLNTWIDHIKNKFKHSQDYRDDDFIQPLKDNYIPLIIYLLGSNEYQYNEDADLRLSVFRGGPINEHLNYEVNINDLDVFTKFRAIDFGGQELVVNIKTIKSEFRNFELKNGGLKIVKKNLTNDSEDKKLSLIFNELNMNNFDLELKSASKVDIEIMIINEIENHDFFKSSIKVSGKISSIILNNVKELDCFSTDAYKVENIGFFNCRINKLEITGVLNSSKSRLNIYNSHIVESCHIRSQIDDILITNKKDQEGNYPVWKSLSLFLAGVKKVDISNLELDNYLDISDLFKTTSLILQNVSTSKELLITNSTLSNTIMTNVVFKNNSKLVIKNSSLVDLETVNMSIPEIDNPADERYEIYKTLKNNYKKQGNVKEHIRFHVLEMNTLLELGGVARKFNLFVSKYTSRHGTSWLTPLIILIAINGIFVIFDGYNSGLEGFSYMKSFLEVFYLTSKIDTNYTDTRLAIITLMRLINIYFAFEVVQAWRQFKK